MDISVSLNGINQYILNPLILLVFAVAFLVFFWGVLQFIFSQTADDRRDEGKRKIFCGLFFIFIIFFSFCLCLLFFCLFRMRCFYWIKTTTGCADTKRVSPFAGLFLKKRGVPIV